MLGLTDISGLTRESMRRYLGEPQTGEVSSRNGSVLPPGVPDHLFLSGSLRDQVDLSTVKIIDFGEG